MSPRVLLKFGITGLFASAVLFVMLKWHSEAWQGNPLVQFTAILGLAVVVGLFFVIVVLPKFGDAVGTVMYSSGEELEQDEGMKAAAKMAAGDYAGAIEEYQKLLQTKPDEVHPISEIAKIYVDKLHQPENALTFIKSQIEGREWPEENAAFLLFRLAGVQTHMQDFEAARGTLEVVVGNFPDTRHSANARHKIRELEEAEFQHLQAARTAEQQPASEPEPDQETV